MAAFELVAGLGLDLVAAEARQMVTHVSEDPFDLVELLASVF